MWLGIALAISALLALPIPSQAQMIWDGDAIPSSLSGQPGDPIKGRTIVTSRQTGLCILCHAGPFPEERFQGNLAPDLKLSVANLSTAQLRARLVDPSKTNTNTIMPAYFRIDHLQRVAPPFAGKTVLSAQEIEDVIAYLLTIKTP
ncbi:MAG: sulfur oxidation c-type cytochrome SoxX [Burkholderiaceae bacterium]|nr:sulfur oxidation c-type cytochrome SoxX [Burkholderiaceae bacterium]